MDAAELETALRSMLARYEGRLEPAEIYGITVLHRPGARAHDWFAGVRPGKGVAKLMLLPIKGNAHLLEGLSPELLRRKSGDALFTLRPGDEALLPELAELVGRAFDAYVQTPGAAGRG
jgi:hypothetical protein